MSNCIICNKKLKIIEIATNSCKCKNIFCSLHKNPEEHKCNYNYRLNKSNDIEKNNKKIVCEKITKI